MSEDAILLIYDKECPACEYYCRLARLRETVGPLTLVNARDDSDVMASITAAGLDIDQGMVLKVGGALYYGADAIHMLALLGSNSGIFNRMNYWLFRSRRLSRLLYPMLKAARNLLLKLLRKTKINNLNISNNTKF